LSSLLRPSPSLFLSPARLSLRRYKMLHPTDELEGNALLDGFRLDLVFPEIKFQVPRPLPRPLSRPLSKPLSKSSQRSSSRYHPYLGPYLSPYLVPYLGPYWSSR